MEGCFCRRHGLTGNLLLLLLVATTIGMSAAAPWRTGNTQAVEHPLDRGATLPALIPQVQSMLSSNTVGPYAPSLWRNASHLWSAADLMAAAVARFFVANNSAAIGAFGRGRRCALADAMVLSDVKSWVLCYANDAQETTEENRMERGNVCDRFRTRSGPTALGVATVHTATFARRAAGDVGCNGGGATAMGVPPSRACVVEITIMEESMQIFHPDEVSARATFAATLASELLHELEAPGASGCVRLAGGGTAALTSASMRGGLRGISLLSVERLGQDCHDADGIASVRTWKQARSANVDAPLDASLTAEPPQDSSSGCGVAEGAAAACNGGLPPDAPRRNQRRFVRLGVATQNVWNFNGEWGSRQTLLSRDLFEVPFPIDVLTLQEVRYHSNAPLRPSRFPNGKAQSLDLVVALNEAPPITAQHAKQPDGSDPSAVYSFGFVPAMTYLHLSRFEAPRIEMEGLMNVLLRPRHQEVDNRNILECDIAVHHMHTARSLLGRNAHDSDDGHQREILCSVLLLETAAGCVPASEHQGNRRIIRVDVCTSHFALGEAAQNRNARDAIRFMTALEASQTFPLGDASVRLPRSSVTVFTGDLNSEPDHPVASLLAQDGFRDAWTLCPDGAGRFGTDHQNTDGLTFNTNDDALVKRIDFVYVKDHSSDDTTGATVDVEACSFMGKQRAEGVEVSSDHLGLAALLRIAL